MAKLWLPIKEPTTNREMILYIPGASHMDSVQLRDIIQCQKEKTLTELKAKGPKPIARFSRAEIGKALKEYKEYLDRQRETVNPRYY